MGIEERMAELERRQLEAAQEIAGLKVQVAKAEDRAAVFTEEEVREILHLGKAAFKVYLETMPTMKIGGRFLIPRLEFLNWQRKRIQWPRLLPHERKLTTDFTDSTDKPKGNNCSVPGLLSTGPLPSVANKEAA